jgi:agmatine deiminase
MFHSSPLESERGTQHDTDKGGGGVYTCGMMKIRTPAVPPAQLGYAMPAEWLAHEATWLAWPHYQKDWPGKFAPVPWVFAEFVRVLARGEEVHICVQPRAAVEVTEILRLAGVDLDQVALHEQATDRAWMRDSGPIFVRRGKQEAGRKKQGKGSALALVDFKFNAWAKYDNWQQDDAIPDAVSRIVGMPRFEAWGTDRRGQRKRFVLEGGSVDVNGQGDVLTTEECLLSRVQQRNPGFSREDIERTLGDTLGIQQVLWLAGGIVGDDTHGHVDDVARFVGPRTIVACAERDRRDVNHSPLRENLRRIKKMRDGRGRSFDIVELPMPGPVWFGERRLPASYANFYISNAGVLVPVFNDPADAVALRLLEECFKDRPVIPIYCRDLVLGRGTIHCLTQQQPAG